MACPLSSVRRGETHTQESVRMARWCAVSENGDRMVELNEECVRSSRTCGAGGEELKMAVGTDSSDV